MSKVKASFEERFWTKVAVKEPDECWLWQGSKRGQYGVFGRTGAHRVSWEIANGPIPDGLDVLHSCDVPLCVNPHHLWVGTHAQNMHDKVIKGRHVTPGGVVFGDVKLIPSDVRKVFELSRQGLSQRQIAKRLQVTQPLICGILRGKYWKNLQPGAQQ